MVNETPIKWPTFQPLRPSFNYIGISDAYELCKAIDGSDNGSEENPYQLGKVDSHLTKNSEWGAVAYLSYSDYGIGNATEVTLNNRSVGGINNVWAVTGFGASTPNANTETIDFTVLTSGTLEGIWYTTQGDNASTTGNVSGVYDMSGGVWEWTAGYIAPNNVHYQNYGGKLKEENSGNSNKYKSKYKGTNGDAANYENETNKKRKGEAIWETSTAGNTNHSSWNKDNSFFLHSDYPFTMRGGRWADGDYTGIFGFENDEGICWSYNGFRAVLVCE